MATAADLLLEPVRTEIGATLAAVDDRRARDRDRHARRRRRRDRRGTTGAPRTPMIVLSGAALVLPDRILSPGTLVIEDGRIAEIRPDAVGAARTFVLRLSRSLHRSGLHRRARPRRRRRRFARIRAIRLRSIAGRLPRYGVTAFCPTTVACPPGMLRQVLDQVRRARETPRGRSARVLPAHLESNFINPEYRGAQPSGCLRSPRAALVARSKRESAKVGRRRSERTASTAPTSSPRSSARRRMSASSPSRRSLPAGSI